jgi:hypothetical protein
VVEELDVPARKMAWHEYKEPRVRLGRYRLKPWLICAPGRDAARIDSSGDSSIGNGQWKWLRSTAFLWSPHVTALPSPLLLASQRRPTGSRARSMIRPVTLRAASAVLTVALLAGCGGADNSDGPPLLTRTATPVPCCTPGPAGIPCVLVGPSRTPLPVECFTIPTPTPGGTPAFVASCVCQIVFCFPTPDCLTPKPTLTPMS